MNREKVILNSEESKVQLFLPIDNSNYSFLRKMKNINCLGKTETEFGQLNLIEFDTKLSKDNVVENFIEFIQKCCDEKKPDQLYSDVIARILEQFEKISNVKLLNNILEAVAIFKLIIELQECNFDISKFQVEFVKDTPTLYYNNKQIFSINDFEAKIKFSEFDQDIDLNNIKYFWIELDVNSDGNMDFETLYNEVKNLGWSEIEKFSNLKNKYDENNDLHHKLKNNKIQYVQSTAQLLPTINIKNNDIISNLSIKLDFSSIKDQITFCDLNEWLESLKNNNSN